MNIPYNLDAEQAVLGALMIAPDKFDIIADILRPDDFYIQANKIIYSAICDIFQRDKNIDVVSLGQFLKDDGTLKQVGGISYLSDLVVNNIAAAGEGYARVVADLAGRRRILTAAHEITGMAADTEFQELRGKAESMILNATQTAKAETFKTAGNSLNRVLKDLLELQGRENVGGLMTGLADLDDLTTGFYPGDLVIIAGRPGMGKTSLAISMLLNISRRVFPIGFISLEMSADQLIRKMLCQDGKIDFQAARRGRLDHSGRTGLTEASGRLYEQPWIIDDPAALDITGLQSRGRRMKSLFGIKALFIDYIGLIRGHRERGDSREREIASISAGLKQLAKELQIPVIALCQLNREVESQIRRDKRPRKSDLRESGSLEQDADTIIMVYREEYYHEQDTVSSDISGVAELLIRKQRNGPEGRVLVQWDSNSTRFNDLDQVSKARYLDAIKPTERNKATGTEGW